MAMFQKSKMEELIAEVKKHPCLYSFDENRDLTSREASWDLISKALKRSVGQVKKEWKNLRDSYRQALVCRVVKKNKTRNLCPWKYERQMKFLKPYVIQRSKYVFKTPACQEDTTNVAVKTEVVSEDENPLQVETGVKTVSPQEGTSTNNSDNQILTLSPLKESESLAHYALILSSHTQSSSTTQTRAQTTITNSTVQPTVNLGTPIQLLPSTSGNSYYILDTPSASNPKTITQPKKHQAQALGHHNQTQNRPTVNHGRQQQLLLTSNSLKLGSGGGGSHNPLELFFSSMFESTKRLPTKYQNDVKKELLASVIKAQEASDSYIEGEMFPRGYNPE